MKRNCGFGSGPACPFIEPGRSEQMASKESGRCPTPRRAGPGRWPAEVVRVTSAASGGDPFSAEAVLADPRWRCWVFEGHSYARGRRGGRTMECTRAFDLPSESRFARHRRGTWRAAGVVSPHTTGEVVHYPWSRVLELRSSSSLSWPSRMPPRSRTAAPLRP
jgi:hypothetical protein